MLQARVFSNFKGSDTLVIWVDDEALEGLLAGLIALAKGLEECWALPPVGDGLGLTIKAVPDAERVSEVTLIGDRIQWNCSRDVAAHAGQLVYALTSSASGHQYIDTTGLAVSQIMIALNEYP